MNTGMIGLIYTGLIFIFIIFGVLFGLIRGFKKTAFRGLFLLASAILIFAISKLIAPLIANLNISWMGITVEGTKVNNIRDIVVALIDSLNTSGSAIESAALADAFVGLSEMLISVLLFWLLFVLFKYLLLPLNSFLFKVIFKNSYDREYKKLKKINKKVHGKVNAFASGNDDGFQVTPINQGDEQIPSNAGASVNSQSFQNNTNINNSYTSQNNISLNNNLSMQNNTNQSTGLNMQSNANLNANPNVSLNNGQTLQTNDQMQEVGSVYIPKNEYQPNFAETEDLKPKKAKKHRLLGGLMGVPVGLFCGAMMLMPVSGVLSIAKEANKVEAVAMESEDGYVQTITKGIYSDIEKGYETSIGNYVMTYTGANFISNLTFNILTTKKINGEKVKIKDDIISAIQTVNSVYELTKVDFNDLNQSKMQDVLNAVEKVLDKALNIGLVNALLKSGINVGVDLVINNDLINLGEFDAVVKNVLTSIKEVDKNALKNEFKGVVNLAKSLNKELEESNQSLLTLLVNGEEIDYAEKLSMLSNEDIDDIVNSIFNYGEYKITATSAIMPDLVNTVFKLGEDVVNEFMKNENNKFEYSDSIEDIKNLSSSSELTESLKTVLKELLNVLKANKDGLGYAIKKVGPILNELSDNKIITTQSFNSLILAVEEYASGICNDLMKDVVDKEELDKVIDSISEIDDWENEFIHIGEAYIIFEENNSEESPMFPVDGDELDLKNVKFDKVAEIADELSKTSLLNNENITSLLRNIVEKQIKKEGDYYIFDAIGLKMTKETNDQLLNNINSINSLKNEILLINSILTGENPVLDIKTLESGIMDNLEMLGKTLDVLTKGTANLNASKLINNEVVVSIITDVINEYKDSGIDDNIKLLLNDVVDEQTGTLKSAVLNDDFSWKTELASLSELKDIDLEGSYYEIGLVLDNVLGNSKLVNNSMVVKVIKNVLSDLKLEGESAIDEAINSIIESVIEDNGTLDDAILNLGFSWANELAKFEGFDELNTNDIASIGKKLDEIVGYGGGEPSLLITNDSIVDAVKIIIDDFKIKSSETTAIEDAFNNILYEITKEGGTLDLAKDKEFSWQSEMEKLDAISKIDFEDDFATIGDVFDSVIDGSVILSNALILIMFETVSESYKIEGDYASAVNGLITDINYNIESLIEADDEISWEKELGNIENLSQLSGANIYDSGELLENASRDSAIITDSIIATMVSSIIEVNKYEGENLDNSKTTINKFLESIQEELSKVQENKVNINWQSEVDHIKNIRNNIETLETIDSTNIGSLIEVMQVIDGIAFNYGENGSENSLIITKSAFTDLMDGIVENLKSNTTNLSEDELIKAQLINNFIDGDIDGDVSENVIGLNIQALKSWKDEDWENANHKENTESNKVGFKWANEITCLNELIESIKGVDLSDCSTQELKTAKLMSEVVKKLQDLQKVCNIIVYNESAGE